MSIFVFHRHKSLVTQSPIPITLVLDLALPKMNLIQNHVTKVIAKSLTFFFWYGDSIQPTMLSYDTPAALRGASLFVVSTCRWWQAASSRQFERVRLRNENNDDGDLSKHFWRCELSQQFSLINFNFHIRKEDRAQLKSLWLRYGNGNSHN